MSTPREHVLFVHAHPDDETISTGGTIATLLDAGASVTLVTCTRGELGEIIPPELQHLSGDALGAYRETELAAAMTELHLTDHRFLGNDGARAEDTVQHRFRDSGMQWGPNGAEPLAQPVPSALAQPLPSTLPSTLPSALPAPPPPTEPAMSPERSDMTLTGVDLNVLIDDISAVIADVQPTAVISYDERGGYGHPDHMRTHEAAGIAALIMDVPFFMIVSDGLGAAGQINDGQVGTGQPGTADIRVDVSDVMDRKKRALQAYRTQLTVDGGTIVHSGGQVEQIGTVEVFRRLTEPRESSVDWKDLGVFSRVASCVFALLLGGVIGAVGTVHHGLAMGAISLLISAGFLVGLRLLLGTRVVAAFAALGLLLVVGGFSLESPGGSVLIQANDVGFIWSYAVPVVALIVLAWPRVGKRSRDTMEEKSDPGKVVDTS